MPESPRNPETRLGRPDATKQEVHQADLAFAREVLRDQEGAIELFVQRMRCVPRILAAQNARMGRPLDEHDLADLTQDTLVVIWRKLDRFAGRSALEGWVYRLCVLELMNAVRKKRRLPRLAEDLGDAPPERAVQPAERGLEEDEIERCMERLGPLEAETIRYKLYDELTFDEIGVRLEVSPNTAKTRYYRGMVKLQQLLRDRERSVEREHTHG